MVGRGLGWKESWLGIHFRIVLVRPVLWGTPDSAPLCYIFRSESQGSLLGSHVGRLSPCVLRLGGREKMVTVIGKSMQSPWFQHYVWIIPLFTFPDTFRIPWTEEPGRLQSMGSLGVGHDWATSLSLSTFMHWRRKWQPTPVFQCSCLENPRDGGAWWAAVYGVAQSRTRLMWLSIPMQKPLFIISTEKTNKQKNTFLC